MLDKIKSFFRKAGDKLSTDTLQRVIDHPKIAMSSDEYNRIQKNKKFYANEFPKVDYLNFENRQKSRPYNAINATKVMAGELASLVFNEGCKITLDNDEAQNFLDGIFKSSKFNKNFREELEAGYAISGLALRPYVDPKTRTIKISFCSADTFFPLNSNTNDVTEAAIVNVSQEVEGKTNIYYTLIEFHEWADNGKYVVTNELYRSDSDSEVGKRVPLTSVDRYKDLKPVTFFEHLTRPMFIYIKLAGKNNIELNSPIGLGVADNAKAQLINLNDTYDQYMHEVKKSATKLMVSDQFLRVRYGADGKPKSYLDPDTDVYQVFKGEAEEMLMKEFVPSLRTDEYTKTMNFILQIAEMNVGFSPGTFSFDLKEGIKTATEVVSENSKTYRTRADNVLLIEEALKELVITIFDLAAMFGLFSSKAEFDVTVDFDDGVFTDKSEKLAFYGKAKAFGMIPLAESIKRTFNLPDEEVDNWVELIREEEKRKLTMERTPSPLDDWEAQVLPNEL